MSILTRPVDELIRYILKRLHGGLLKNDLDINNFSSHISGGRFHLSNIELNPEAVNAMLPDSPVHLVSARVAQITVQTPSLTRFLEDPIIVEAQELEVDLCSALYSHSRVLRVPEVRLEVSESPDDSAESAMIFGKAIERIITNMKFSLLRTRIRLKAHPEDAQSVDLFLPEIWLKDTSVVGGPFKIKELKLKGLILFVTKDRPPSVLNPYDYSHICQMDEETAISIAVSKETIKVDIAVKRILLILAPSQAEIVFRILTALEKSRNEEQASEEVMEDLLQRTYLSLDEDVRRSLEIEPRKQKKASVKVVLSDFAVVGMMQEPIASESRKWQFQKPGEPYTYLNAPHLVLSASACAIDKTPIRCVFTVKALEIHHHDLVETVCLGSSSLFVSARESYSSEFFRTDSVRDEFWHLDPEIYHICSTPVLYFDVLREPVHSYLPDYDISLPKQNLKIVLSQETMSIKTGTLFMNLKEPLFRAMKTYLKLFPKPRY